jgi:transcription-repair coupling factor (superfamily II helicase)
MLKIKFFKKIAKVSGLYLWENGDFQNTEDLFLQTNSLLKPKKLLKNYLKILSATRAIIFNQASFIKKSSRLFGLNWVQKHYLEQLKVWVSYSATAVFNKQFDLLLNNLSENHFNGFKNYLFCSNDAQCVSTIFWNFRRSKFRECTQEYHTIVMPLYRVLLMKKTKSPVIQIIRFWTLP